MARRRTHQPPLLEAIGQQVRSRRVESGSSRKALARNAAISPTTLAGIEDGSVAPTIETLVKLAHALRVRVADLLEDAPPPQRPSVSTKAFHRVVARIRDRDGEYLRAVELMLDALDRAAKLAGG